MTVNMDEYTRRVSTAWAYLIPEVRCRSSLELRTKTTLISLLIEGNAAVGVIAERAGICETFRADRVILSAGSLVSPAILMRSGIEPSMHLADCGIEVLRDLLGVGQNLLEHPSAGLLFFLKPAARQKGTPHCRIPMGHRFLFRLEGCPLGDMHMNFVVRIAWHAAG